MTTIDTSRPWIHLARRPADFWGRTWEWDVRNVPMLFPGVVVVQQAGRARTEERARQRALAALRTLEARWSLTETTSTGEHWQPPATSDL